MYSSIPPETPSKPISATVITVPTFPKILIPFPKNFASPTKFLPVVTAFSKEVKPEIFSIPHLTPSLTGDTTFPDASPNLDKYLLLLPNPSYLDKPSRTKSTALLPLAPLFYLIKFPKAIRF